MADTTSSSELLIVRPTVSAPPSPLDAVRDIVERQSGISPLPATRYLQLFHVRGVAERGSPDGGEKEFVIYGPEFLYVLDVGFPAFAGVQLGMKVSGLGDPRFPDFSSFVVRSVEGYAPRELLFPLIPGRLLVGVKNGTPEVEVRKALATYATKITPWVTDLYLLEVKFFHEEAIAHEIEAKVAIVRYAEPDRVQRLIDFSPGWFVDRVC